MSITNKIIVKFYLEPDCDQEEGETGVEWTPINFSIYSSLFPDLIQEAVDQWLDENKLLHAVVYEVIFAHRVERDGGGALLGEHFEAIHQETQAV